MKACNIVVEPKYEHLATMYLVESYAHLGKFNEAIAALRKYLEKSNHNEGILEKKRN